MTDTKDIAKRILELDGKASKSWHFNENFIIGLKGCERNDAFEVANCGHTRFPEDKQLIIDYRNLVPILARDWQAQQKKLDGAVEALEEIKLGKGRYSQDHFEHARNCIEDMKELAQQALEKIKEEK